MSLLAFSQTQGSYKIVMSWSEGYLCITSVPGQPALHTCLGLWQLCSAAGFVGEPPSS